MSTFVHGALATDLHPEALVLREGQLPAGFVLDTKASRPTPNDAYTRPAPLRQLIKRAGRVGGYVRVYRLRTPVTVRTVHSAADLYRGAHGARLLLDWNVADQQAQNASRIRQGGSAYRRLPAQLGTEGWVYWSGSPERFTFVIWRHRRVLASVVSWGLGRARTLSLARRQQFRIRTTVP